LDGLVPRNVCEAVKPPKGERKEIKPLDREQTKALLVEASGHRLEALYVLAVHCGLREGELLALHWEDADLEADKPALLVVYSDSPETGFSWGLRGGGRRGDAAGVGVVSKWRAWVDLEWGGDWQEAAKAVWEGEAGELSRRWGEDTAWMQEAGEVMSRSADWLSAGEIE
jgi:hypothetical protein